MKKSIRFLFVLFILLNVTSCGTIYQAAVDERNIGTIANDTKIKTKILKSYADDDQMKVLDFSVSCYEGHVYLIGEYKTKAQKDRAVDLAKQVEGVKDVTTYMLPEQDVAGCDTKKNLELTAKTKAKLVGDKSIWSTNIDIKTMQCVVVLWGLVGSGDEIDKAIAHARSVEGVKSVKSLLKAAK